MELKTIVAIGLVVFIVGALIFLKIRGKKEITTRAAEMEAVPFTYQNKRRFLFYGTLFRFTHSAEIWGQCGGAGGFPLGLCRGKKHAVPQLHEGQGFGFAARCR